LLLKASNADLSGNFKTGDRNLLTVSQGNSSDCDCSTKIPCIFPTDITASGLKIYPGGGQGDVSSSASAWGSFDPVSKMPRLSCQDTVHHAHYPRFKLPQEVRKNYTTVCPNGECIAPTNR
jgi:hypothetical protein